jgi:hypothetical protein
MGLLGARSFQKRQERMSSRKRKTVAASVRLCVGGRFWRSNSCATLRASTITRSELIRKQRGRGESAG